MLPCFPNAPGAAFALQRERDMDELADRILKLASCEGDPLPQPMPEKKE